MWGVLITWGDWEEKGETTPRSEPWLATLGVLLTRMEGGGRERGRGFKFWTHWACASLREKLNRHFDICLVHPEKESNDRIYSSSGETDFHFCFKTQIIYNYHSNTSCKFKSLGTDQNFHLLWGRMEIFLGLWWHLSFQLPLGAYRDSLSPLEIFCMLSVNLSLSKCRQHV